MSLSYVNLFLVVYLSSCISSNNIEQIRLRGIQTSFLSLYVPSKPFTCLDGSMTIPFEFLNDDYCDCRDGSDEPGTSACPNGRFYCENKGHVGALIPSHQVGDGICDCCDGSDEYEQRIVCNNTCFELAKRSQVEREAKRALHEAGVTKKKDIIAKSVEIATERKTRLNELEIELKKIKTELKSKEDEKQQAENAENLAKEKHLKLWQNEQDRREAVKRERQSREIFTDLDTNQDASVSIDELQKHVELDLNKENEFTHEEVRTILGADSVNYIDFNLTVFDQISNMYQKLNLIDGSTMPTSLEHEKHLHDDAMPEYDDETKKLIELAEQARQDYNGIHDKSVNIQREIDDLEKQNNLDIGVQGEFAAFIDQCYDYEEREYTYRVCMFKEAKQISKGGGSDVMIGYWNGWIGPSNDKYRQMKYGNGATCWNGPPRSLTVTFQCGIEHRILDVREPSRCEYAMLFESPSACDERIANTSTHIDHVEF